MSALTASRTRVDELESKVRSLEAHNGRDPALGEGAILKDSVEKAELEKKIAALTDEGLKVQRRRLS